MFVGLGLLEVFADFNLILKLFAFLTIASFVMNHLGKGPLAVGLMALMGYFILFDAWAIFGGIYLLFAIVTLGFANVLIDFFFVTPPMANQQEQQQQQEPEGINSQDVKERLHRLHAAQGRPQQGRRPPGPPPMMG